MAEEDGGDGDDDDGDGDDDDDDETGAYAQGCPCRRGRCAQQPAGDLRAHAALFSRLAYGSKQASAAQRHRNSGRLEPKWLRKMTTGRDEMG